MDFQHIEATFGKLEHCSLSFSSGLNIIEAPNESGKSTLLAFLRVMLYGFPPRERGALADKNRYAPWSLSPMRGTLSLSSQKGNITLQRDTARANSPMGRFSAIYTGSGESVDGLTAADCGETLLGIPCEVYERSAFIRQSSLTVDASAELERRIAALITTGEEGRSFSEASAALKKQLNARKYNKSGRIPALEAAVAAQERSLAELSQLTRSRQEAEAALAAFDAKPIERVHSLLPYIIVSAVLFAALMVIQTLPAAVAMAGRVLSGIALLALLIIDANSRRKVRRVHDEKRRVFEQALQEAQSDAAAQQKLCDSAAQELLVLIPAGDISRVSTYLDTALHKYAELDTLEREARELSLRCELLSAQQPQSDVPTEPAVRPTRSRTELQSALDALTVRRREAQSTFDYTSGRCRAIGDAAELEAGLAQKRTELAQNQGEYDAIALAMEALQSANTALQNRFSPALSRRAGELFSRLTGGKYESVLLDRTFSAQAGEAGESISHDAQLLSLGTLDQLYLAVRLAICESVLPEGDPPPIVLDDALVRFDDARCRAALDLLLEESKSRQILLFTCQHRESAYLAGRDGVTLLSL